MAKKTAPVIAPGEIRFDQEKHACWLGGERLPAVGTILRKAASAFNPWAKDEVTPEARARMDRGKTIHETLELCDKGMLGAHDPMCDPYIAAAQAVKAHYGIAAWEAIEEPRASAERRYWGIIDRFHPAVGVCEFKTGSARPYSYRVAVAGYCLLWGATRGRVIYLGDSGTFDAARDVEEVTGKDFEAFEMALKLAEKGESRW